MEGAQNLFSRREVVRVLSMNWFTNPQQDNSSDVKQFQALSFHFGSGIGSDETKIPVLRFRFKFNFSFDHLFTFFGRLWAYSRQRNIVLSLKVSLAMNSNILFFSRSIVQYFWFCCFYKYYSFKIQLERWKKNKFCF